ncbi:MAG TPA: PAS domain-containing sensor histidine kinase, partial [Planctomycetaceae bacterium]|nr:PAS domain-containing sensor histidine kinase [Planctomycetaceae bacterium]
DESRKLSYVNARWTDLTGLERWSWKRMQDPVELVHTLDRDDVRSAWRRAWLEGTRFESEFRLIHADGSIRWVYVVAEPLKDDQQQCVGFVGYAMDITPLKQSMETLQQREAELAHVSRLATMGQMMAELSHEINQPLYSISNYAGALAEFLKSQNVDRFDTAIGWAERIGRIAADAGEIIRRLRSFTAHPSPAYEPLELATTVREALSLLEWQLRRTNACLELRGFDERHPVMADRVAIQQVVVNLVKNACEAVEDVEPTKTPQITVTIQGGPDAVQVEIADNGRGLPECDPEDLFLAFTSYHPGGSGMGLAVSRSIVEQHGGKIWAASNDEGGATFVFCLPRQAGNEATSSPARFE